MDNERKPNMLDQVVLGEVAGKNNAIHAYDKIIWTIRSGYLTLIFVGWSVLLKSYAETNMKGLKGFYVATGLLLVTFGLTLGGYFMDRAYVRRKFRVILALNNLVDAIKVSSGVAEAIPCELLKVAGDDGDAKYDCSGYREALKGCRIVYFCPLLTLALAAFIIFL